MASRTRREPPRKSGDHQHSPHRIASGQRTPIPSIMQASTMMKRVAIVLFVGICLQGDYAAQPERSTSPSRQFVIYGVDAKVRGAVSSLAEQTKANLLALLRQRDDWKTPVVVNLQSQQANLPEVPPADLRFSQTGFGIKLQLDVTVAAPTAKATRSTLPLRGCGGGSV